MSITLVQEIYFGDMFSGIRKHRSLVEMQLHVVCSTCLFVPGAHEGGHPGRGSSTASVAGLWQGI